MERKATPGNGMASIAKITRKKMHSDVLFLKKTLDFVTTKC
jgi:hypothetical protein